MSMKKLALIGAVTLLMAGCSSVNLDNPPIDDRSSGAGTGSSSTTVAQTSVTPVDDGKSAQAAIANVSRLVYFDYDSYVIKPEFQALIDTHARHIKADKSRKVVIEGHTDERGGREYNLALGQRRAEAVRRSLGLLGVADSQVEAVSFGKEKPAMQGTGEAAWSKNRRAEISYR
ncbi:peptidoglycan-associated lipoprotein Pal [Curvibacter sp. PAE-UM]|uniref:peptidoglycan-associated lipoprotein Pal n=1 Tax=Curvibacter sp. PAE-UM TaxID=1714344 RepID=UPI00070D76FF|nr:peptidoglycan-binding protein [Curvibacter sp. PAE-UM]